MTISKFTLIHMNQIDISNHRMSPREKDSAAPIHENEDDIESEFYGLGDEDSERFATYFQESKASKVTKRRSAVKQTRRSSAKYTILVKKTSKQTRRKSLTPGLESKSMKITKEDFKRRVRNTVGRSSLHIHRNRLQSAKVEASKVIETWNA